MAYLSIPGSAAAINLITFTITLKALVAKRSLSKESVKNSASSVVKCKGGRHPKRTDWPLNFQSAKASTALLYLTVTGAGESPHLLRSTLSRS